MKRRVLVIGLNRLLIQHLQDALRQAELAIAMGPDDIRLLGSMAAPRPDVIIIGDTLLLRDQRILYNQLKLDTHTIDVPVIMLTNTINGRTPAVTPLGGQDYQLSLHTFTPYTLVELLRSMQII